MNTHRHEHGAKGGNSDWRREGPGAAKQTCRAARLRFAREAIRVHSRSFAVPLLLVASAWPLLSASGQTDFPKNQYSTAVLRPPDYETFRPPPAGQTFRDPVFGTEILVLTDDHSITGFNGERANFSQDDKYFFVGAKPAAGKPDETWLYDGRSGAFLRKIPIPNADNARWAYDPKMIVYFTEKQVRGYNVETDEDKLIKEFPEPLGNGQGRVCGGDGNDFDDKGEWILLNYAYGFDRMFTFNIRTGETGREFSLVSHGKPSKTKNDPGRVDYATISPSGKYAVAIKGLHGPDRQSGVGLYDRNGTFLRCLSPFAGHAEFGYLNGTEECVVLKAGKGHESFLEPGGVGPRERYGVRFSDGKVVRLTLRGTIFGQLSAIGGSNRKYIYWAMESDGNRPDGNWDRYSGEIVEVPLDGSLKVRRLLHHRARPDEAKREAAWGLHTFGDQPELWINHAGDRLFFRSNMFLQKGSTKQKYGNDLFLIKIPPREEEDAR
ncbi:MAG: hypothetical protein JXR37_04005 [Kiritimatiellae bacterium]|nr:hypothetical protein [Kiritimatiellia bacterium]